MPKVSALAEEVAFLRQEVATLKSEVRLLRRGAATGDEDSLETLLAYLHDAFGDQSWPATQVFELATEHPLYAGQWFAASEAAPQSRDFPYSLCGASAHGATFSLICSIS